MEDILDVYERPYDPIRLIVCMDEKPYQLLGEVRESWAMRPDDDKKIDAEYQKNRTCCIFAMVEPLGWRHHVSVHERSTAMDWAEEIEHLVDVMYPNVDKITLVMDNLNSHKPSLSTRNLIHRKHTDCLESWKSIICQSHGNWLDIAEIELNAMTRQCLPRHIPNIDMLRKELSVWERERNNSYAKVNWQFKTNDARIKLRSLYPKIDEMTLGSFQFQLLTICKQFICSLFIQPFFQNSPISAGMTRVWLICQYPHYIYNRKIPLFFPFAPYSTDGLVLKEL